MEVFNFSAPAATLRHANARMLNRYMPWVDSMLTITFGKTNLHALPGPEQARAQLRHLGATLNGAVWGNRTKFNPKCQILYVPIIEGVTTSTRIHAHILLGNVKSLDAVHQHMRSYIPRSNWIAPRYDLTAIYDADGAAWYVAKEAHKLNEDAIAWEIASIPQPLRP